MKSRYAEASVVAMAVAAAIGLAGWPEQASAETNEALRERVLTMEEQLQELKKRLDGAERKAEEAKKEATTEDNRAIKWHFTGYGTADFTYNEAGNASSSFAGGRFVPIFLVSYKDLMLFEGELETSVNTDGTTEVALEFANLNLFATDWLTVTAGKFLSPIGAFQQYLHPAWINKLPGRPAGFADEAGAAPLTEVGVMARGAFPIQEMRVDYAFYVGNGPRLATEAGEGVLLEGYGGDDNDDKAFGGRIALHPLPSVTVGISGMRAKVKGNAGTGGAVSEGDYDLQAVDLAFKKGNFDIRGEFIRAHLGKLTTALDATDAPAPISDATWYAWYAQAAYRLAGVTDHRILRNFEPVIRYSQFTVSGPDEFKEKEEKRWTVGFGYWFAPSIVAKAAYEMRNFSKKEDEDVVRLQVGFGF